MSALSVGHRLAESEVLRIAEKGNLSGLGLDLC